MYQKYIYLHLTRYHFYVFATLLYHFMIQPKKIRAEMNILIIIHILNTFYWENIAELLRHLKIIDSWLFAIKPKSQLWKYLNKLDRSTTDNKIIVFLFFENEKYFDDENFAKYLKGKSYPKKFSHPKILVFNKLTSNN